MDQTTELTHVQKIEALRTALAVYPEHLTQFNDLRPPPTHDPIGFHKQTLEIYSKLLKFFKTVNQERGDDTTFSMQMFEGIVYINSYTLQSERSYSVEWFGKPESFGLRIGADGSVYGPYHIH